MAIDANTVRAILEADGSPTLSQREPGASALLRRADGSTLVQRDRERMTDRRLGIGRKARKRFTWRVQGSKVRMVAGGDTRPSMCIVHCPCGTSYQHGLGHACRVSDALGDRMMIRSGGESSGLGEPRKRGRRERGPTVEAHASETAERAAFVAELSATLSARRVAELAERGLDWHDA